VVRKDKKRMAQSLTLTGSSLGKKAVMAASGVILFGFVLTHMAGNLKIYQGREAYNHYAEGLRQLGAPFFPETGLLWVARLVLLAAVAAHIVSAFQLWSQNRSARPSRYEKPATIQADYAVRTMRWGGLILLLFVVYHLLHLTLGSAHPDFVAGDVYHNVVTGFRQPLVSAFYIVANLALGFHLYHGVWSLGRSLGISDAVSELRWRKAAAAFAFLVTAGNVSFPIAVLTGVVG
jgi:succinate dehydrogenase / fumarate reductase, cytochrome b subunit